MGYVLILAGCLAASAAAAQSQPRDTAAIPRDLALALIMHTSGLEDPTFVVGRLPDPAMAPLVPPGARVLGGISYRGRGGSGNNHTTVLEVRESPDSSMAVLQAAVERLGWRRPSMMSDRGEGGGFVTREIVAGPTGGLSTSFCRPDSDGSFMTIAVAPAREVSVVRLMTYERSPVCDERRGMRRGRFPEIELPTLVPPPGVGRVGGQGMSGSESSREASIELSSSLSAAAMIAHFGPQLEQQEWTLGARVDHQEVTALTATKRAANGDTLHLVLVGSRFGENNHHVSVRVWNPAARDRRD